MQEKNSHKTQRLGTPLVGYRRVSYILESSFQGHNVNDVIRVKQWERRHVTDHSVPESTSRYRCLSRRTVHRRNSVEFDVEFRNRTRPSNQTSLTSSTTDHLTKHTKNSLLHNQCLPCVYLERPCLEVNPHDKAWGLADQSMRKPILVHLIVFSLFLRQFRLGASTVSLSKLFLLSMTQFEKKYFLISVLYLGLQIFLLWPRKPLSLPLSVNKTVMSISV